MSKNPINIDDLLQQLQATLPKSGGQWRLTSLSASVPLEPRAGDPDTPPAPERKDSDPAPTSPPVKPGAPKIEAVYEWEEA
ncbi:MAG TPA: hypothetical protein PKO41_03100 [Dokdonella sp.]|uniref:hypothetical protein n=1 Tax=Dokdonella sp. TaxID=2291710 RepID=UPI0025C49714|nr:hypothetical protein [Dokdonella sp.]MBX3690877.1 hypothetical protein [Dokdonella sp.]MCW5569147.1 hypothetical protein [Dokdonella sp.]HNR91393.1 hypothetical protein [Dokdonella sp.]